MLKIKDIEIFEKYGFVENKNLASGFDRYYLLKKDGCNCSYFLDIFFVINIVNKYLRFETSAYAIQDYEAEDFADILFDLIQAGLVEKVVEDE